MKKIILVIAFIFFPIYTQNAFATTDAQLITVPNSVSSNTLSTVDETRKGFTGNFDDFVGKFRDLSIPIIITTIAIAGFLLLIGIVVSPLRKFAFTILGGGMLGFVFINFGEYIVGFYYAAVDFIISYFK